MLALYDVNIHEISKCAVNPAISDKITINFVVTSIRYTSRICVGSSCHNNRWAGPPAECESDGTSPSDLHIMRNASPEIRTSRQAKYSGDPALDVHGDTVHFSRVTKDSYFRRLFGIHGNC